MVTVDSRLVSEVGVYMHYLWMTPVNIIGTVHFIEIVLSYSPWGGVGYGDMLRNNSLGPRRCGSNIKSRIFQQILQKSSLGIRCEIVLRGMPGNLTDEKSTLAQLM